MNIYGFHIGLRETITGPLKSRINVLEVRLKEEKEIIANYENRIKAFNQIKEEDHRRYESLQTQYSALDRQNEKLTQALKDEKDFNQKLSDEICDLMSHKDSIAQSLVDKETIYQNLVNDLKALQKVTHAFFYLSLNDDDVSKERSAIRFCEMVHQGHIEAMVTEDGIAPGSERLIEYNNKYGPIDVQTLQECAKLYAKNFRSILEKRFPELFKK